MSLIIKEENDLKDPFICSNVFMNYCKEAGEDYIDYNDSIVNPYPFLMWLLGKGYITPEQGEKLIGNDYLSVQTILKDEVVFPNSFGESDIANAKVYSLLAEYMSLMKSFRERVIKSAGNEASAFNGGFYTDKDGNSLALMVHDEDCIKHNNLIDKEIIFKGSLRDVYDMVINKTIQECDINN